MAGTQAEIEAEMTFNGGDERAATALVNQNTAQKTAQNTVTVGINNDKEESA